MKYPNDYTRVYVLKKKFPADSNNPKGYVRYIWRVPNDIVMKWDTTHLQGDATEWMTLRGAEGFMKRYELDKFGYAVTEITVPKKRKS